MRLTSAAGEKGDENAELLNCELWLSQFEDSRSGTKRRLKNEVVVTPRV